MPITAGEADQDQLTAAARAVEQIQGEAEARAASLLLFAKVDGTDSPIPVADSESWPAATEVSYILLPDSLGRVRYLQEVPVSQSGDWHNTYTHYFAEDGRTLLFERYSGFFNGCRWGLAKEWTESVFGEAGEVIERTYRLEDANGKAHDPAECEAFYHRYPYEVFPSWATAAQALGLPTHPNNGG